MTVKLKYMRLTEELIASCIVHHIDVLLMFEIYRIYQTSMRRPFDSGWGSHVQ